jgi:hypothetical protein
LPLRKSQRCKTPAGAIHESPTGTFLGKQLDGEHHQADQKHEDRDFVDGMHGLEVEAIAPVGRGGLLLEGDVRDDFAPDFHRHS